MSMYKKVSTDLKFVEREKAIEAFWKENNIFERIISIKYDVPNDKLSMFDDYKVAIDNFYAEIMAENA